jgi:23S rRNA A1618 N6-methylase RlmF
MKNYGVKVVGSYIGSSEFIKHQLDVYFQELEDSASKLMNHKDLQERMILFRDSFLKKPLHIFRTVNPKFTQEFARKFEVLKIKVLCSILGFDSSEHLSDLHCKIAQLSIKEGGLGLQDHCLVGKAAFVASVIGFHQKFKKVLTADVDLSNISEESFLGQFMSLSQLFCGVDKYSSTSSKS